MKKILFSLLVLLLIPPFSYQALAGYDSLTQGVVSPGAEAMTNADSGGFIVQGDGTLVTKPGNLFSEGAYAANFNLPYLISTPKPITYPRWAIRQGWQGKFVLAIEVLKDGSVGRVQIMQSTGHQHLDKTTEDAVKSWHFQPAMQDGKPVVECVQVPVYFQLDKS